ncbi:hypothetical protein PFISCL1PPCAC_22717, partial [Pristionchus fissidentatus]
SHLHFLLGRLLGCSNYGRMLIVARLLGLLLLQQLLRCSCSLLHLLRLLILRLLLLLGRLGVALLTNSRRVGLAVDLVHEVLWLRVGCCCCSRCCKRCCCGSRSRSRGRGLRLLLLLLHWLDWLRSSGRSRSVVLLHLIFLLRGDLGPIFICNLFGSFHIRLRLRLCRSSGRGCCRRCSRLLHLLHLLL